VPVPAGGGAGHDDALGVDHLAHDPPQLLAEAMRVGLRPICSAEIFWRLPKRTLDDVSDPVRATPSQPGGVPKNG